MEAAGIELPKPPKKIMKTWDFAFNEASYADFTKVYEYLRKKMGDYGPDSEQVLAERMLALGLKWFVNEIAKDQKKSGVQLYVPGDMAEASKRIQALKEGR